MSYTTIPSGNIGELKAIIQSIWSLIKSNFEDHADRLNDLESGGAPTGMIICFGSSTPPSGWLLCDGSVVSQATYADLYAIIGTNFNTGGEGAGNFRLPNLLGRVAIGEGQDSGLGLSNRTIGTTLGAETHQLVSGEMPSHSHSVTDPGHTHVEADATGTSTGRAVDTDINTSSNQSTESNTTGITINNEGSGTAHNNMQPFLVAAYIIKT